MDFLTMQLHSRVERFATIIANVVCTDSSQSTINLEKSMDHVMGLLRKIQMQANSLYIIGNGGSAAVASHAQIDFINVAKINAHVLHEPSLLTCMANDFGYENVYSRVIKQFIKKDDLLIAISSSGQSSNICNAVKAAKLQGVDVITFTGFDSKNILRQLGDYNFWLDSVDYGFVEVGHQFILHNLSDRFGIENHIKLKNQETLMTCA